MVQQPQSKGERCSGAGKILLQMLATVSLATNVTGTPATTPWTQPHRTLQTDVSTPDFGACNTSPLSCAHSPSSCDDSFYIHAADLQITECDSPFRVEIGRCAGDKLTPCAADSSSCGNPSAYTPHDPTCSLAQDTNADRDGLTQYPYCRRTDAGFANPFLLAYRCVLSGDECISGEEELLPFNATGTFNRCFCHQVPIGLCYDPAPNATDGSAVCAVASYDCAPGFLFRPAFELSETDLPLRCRLCDVEDLRFYNLHEAVVESGRCITRQGVYGDCQLEATGCPDSVDLEFRSSAQLEANGVRGCPADVFPGGDCAADPTAVHCTNKAGACSLEAAFHPRSTCRVHTDSLSGEPMYFGRCVNRSGETTQGSDARCVWDSSECDPATEDYTFASYPTNWYDGCTCEKVRTGACRDASSGELYCAVSELGCAADDAYVNSTGTAGVGVDCRLCQRTRIPPAPSVAPSAGGTGAPTEEPTSSTLFPTRETTNTATFAPTPTARGALYDDDGSSESYDGDYDDTDDTNFAQFLTFAPTPTAMLGMYDDYDDSFGDDNESDDGSFDTALIISGSVGGTILLTCIAILFYYRNPLPIKLYVTEEDKEIV